MVVHRVVLGVPDPFWGESGRECAGQRLVGRCLLGQHIGHVGLTVAVFAGGGLAVPAGGKPCAFLLALVALVVKSTL